MQHSQSSLRRYGWAWLVMVSVTCGLSNFALGFADEKSELPAKAKAILTAKCYSCHGEAGSADGGINFMLNRDRLVKRRKLVVGQSDDSVIFRQIKTGRMPKDGEPLSAEEVDVMKRWIDSGAVDFNPKTNARTFISPDDVLTWIRDDLRALEKDDPEKLPYFRYFTITHLYNSGLSNDELQSYRVALAKLVNSLSWKKRIVLPHPIDPAKTVLRICLSDYRWSPKTWDRIAEEYPYGVKSLAPAMQFCYSATKTNLPCVRADWFVAKAAMPPLYHEILELPESVDELEQLLRIDVEHNIASGDAARAAFNGSGVSSHNRLIERHDCDLTGGLYWKSYDFGEDKGRRNLFSHPLGPGGENGFEHDGGELFFSLPNGLQAYLLVDKDGRRIDKGPISVVSDPRRPDKQVVNGLSCMSCHSEGVKRKADEVRAAVVANPKAFTTVEVTQVKKLYKTNADLEKLFDADAKHFAKAVAQTGGKTTGDEPIVMLALRFEEEVDVDLAAAEVGMTTETLKIRLEKSSLLSRQLPTMNVPGGTVKRETFVATFPMLVRELRLGQFLGPADSAKEELPDIPAPRATSPTVRSKSSSSSKAFRPATRAPADLVAAQNWHNDNLQRLHGELAEMRRRTLEEAVPKLRTLQAKATKAGQLTQAVAIRDLADRFSQNGGGSAKQWDSLKSTSGLPNEAAAIVADILKEGSADSSRLAEEIKKLNLELAQRMEPTVAAALIGGDLEKSRQLISQLFSLRDQSFPYNYAGRSSKPPAFSEEALKFVRPFKNQAEQQLAIADKEEERLRKALLIKLKEDSKRKDLSDDEKTALAATIDFLDADYSTGLRFVQVLKPDRRLPEPAVAALTEFIAAANALTVKLSEEHQAAWKTLNDELKSVRMALAKKGAFESAFVVLEQTPNLKRVLEPIAVKAAIGSSSSPHFGLDGELMEIKGGQFLIRYKQGAREPEWVSRDRFRIQGESVDSTAAATAALNAGDLELSRQLLTQLYSARGQAFPYHHAGGYSKSPVLPDEALKLVEPFKIKADQRRTKADKEELTLRNALISKLKAEAKRKDLSEDETAALERNIDFLDAEYSKGLRFVLILKADQKLPELAMTAMTEFTTAANALTVKLSEEHQAAWEPLNEELKTLRKALAKKGEFESAFVVLEQMPPLKRVFEPIAVKAAFGSSSVPNYLLDGELAEIKSGQFLIRYNQGGRESEWVTRDRFRIQSESVDATSAATAALNAGDLELSRDLLSQLYSSRGKSFPYRFAGRSSKPTAIPDEALKLVEPFKIKADQRRTKVDKDELKLRKALISKLKVEAKRKDLSGDETTALETTVHFLDADDTQGLRFLTLFKEDRKLPEAAGAAVAEFVTATNALTLAMTKEHHAAWEALNEDLKTLRKALAKKGEFESAFVILEQTPSLKRVFEPISVKAARGSFSSPHFVWDAELLEVKGDQYSIRYKQGRGDAEWVTRDQIQFGVEASGPFAAARRPQPPAGSSTSQNQPPPGEPVTNTTKLIKGQRLIIASGRSWAPVTVLDLTPTGVKIHWVGWSDSWDEVVDRSRLRLTKEDEKEKK